MEYVDRVGLLAVPVDAAVALLHPVRVERHLHVDQPVTRPVQVDALRGRVGGEQHPHRGLVGVVVELADDPLPLVGVEASVEHLDPARHRGPITVRRRQHLVEVVERGPILRENDDPLVVPFSVGETDLTDPVHQPLRFGVCSAPAVIGPDPHLIQDRLSDIDAHRPCPHPCEQHLLLFAIDVGKRSRGQSQSLLLLVRHGIGVVGVVFEGGRGLLQRPLGGLAVRGRVERSDVLVERVLERGRRRQQPLLEQQRDEPARSALSRRAGRTHPQRRVVVQQVEQLPLLRRERHLDSADAPFGEAGVAVGEHRAQMRLQAAHHHSVALPVARLHALGEPVRVEHLKQRLERLRVPVVGSRGEEQPMLEVRGQAPHRLGAQRLPRVAAHRGRSDPMGLVHDEQIKRPRIGVGIRRQELIEPAHLRLELDPLHRHDQPRMGPERVDTHTALASQPPDMLGVDDLKAETELFAHLALPFAAQARRADHHDLLSLVAQHQLLRDQSRLDGLAETDIVGDQQAHPGHPQRFDQRQELVVLNVYAGPERRLERAGVSRRDSTPAGRVEERRERVGLIDPVVGVRQLGLGTNLGAGLGLPENTQRCRASLVVDRHQTHKVVARPSVRAHRIQRTRRLPHRLDHPVPVPHPNKVPLLGHSHRPLRLNDRHVTRPTRRHGPSTVSIDGARPRSCVL